MGRARVWGGCRPMVWQKDVCQRRDLLDLQIDDTGMGGLVCLPEKDYGVDTVRPPSRESVVADRLHTAVSGLADALQSTVAVFEGRGRTLRPGLWGGLVSPPPAPA